jgi:3-epi-6-deoxocathasterone 23-monooxygenase
MQEENIELKNRKTDSCDDYGWTDYMSLQFTQNVSLKKLEREGN